MSKRFFAVGIALLFVIGFNGCGDDVDPEEQYQADQLIQGFGATAMMTNVDAYSGYSSFGPGLASPPLGWSGPLGYDVPEGTDTLYYEFFWKLPLDSMGTVIDTVIWLAMPEPDVWGGDTMPWTGLDTWIIGQTRPLIYFHTVFSMVDTISVNGTLKWNWEETFYEYAFDVMQDPTDYTAEIDITTSVNIGLSAQFRIIADGSGSETENFASWNNMTFVRYEFFVRGVQEYDGYYTLLSEGWNVRHYFNLIVQEQA